MSENPYQSPLGSSLPHAPKPVNTTAIIWSRRVVIVCVALLVPYFVLCLFLLDPPISPADLRETLNPQVQILIHCVALVSLLVASIVTGLLASKIYGAMPGVIFGLVAFYPVIGFLAMAWVLYRSRRLLDTEATAAGTTR